MVDAPSPGITRADIARRIADLPPERRALLERHLLAATPAAAAAPQSTCTSRPRDRPARMSFAQERLWFLDRLDPGSARYHLPLILPIDAAAPDAAVATSWATLSARHAMLRTTIAVADGQPVQIVADAVPLRVTAMPADQMRDAIAREMLAPFDLTAGPPLRATLFRDAGHGARVLVIVLHHILTDGWSNAILAREFTGLLAEARGGPVAALPPLATTYADYAEAQRDRLAGPHGEALLAYWRDRLAGAPQLLELPSEARSGAVPTPGSGVLVLALDDDTDIAGFARARHATPFMVLLAAFFALLHRTSGEADLLVGTPVANRSRIELEPLVGLFVNTLPLRVQVTPGDGFATLLDAVRTTVLDAHAHQDLPFEEMVAQSVGVRDATRPPLVQMLFAFEPGVMPDSEAPIADVGAKFDLTLTVLDGGTTLAARWDYDPAVLDAATVARLARAYRVLLSAAIADCDRPIAALPLLTLEQEQVEIAAAAGPALAPWDDADEEPRTLSGWFADVAARVPAATALRDGDRHLTYAALATRTEAAAAALHAQGIGPGDAVGICVARGTAMIVAILAILRLGAAYVPLDPGYPDARIAFMAHDAGLALIVAVRADHARLATALKATPVPLYASDTLLHDAEGPVPDIAATEGNTAYILYTSGSTGRPKGVVIAHRAILNQIRWLHDRWPLAPEDRVLQRTSLSFDASVWEIFAPLLAGAQLVLAQDARGAFAELGATIRAQRVTVVQFVPSLLRVLLEAGALDGCTQVRRLFCGGEPLDAALAARAAAVTGAAVVNLYGPTEAAVNALADTLSPDAPTDTPTDRAGGTMPIGRPVANMRAYILDPSGALVLPGMIGELYLGGIGLADRYVGRAGLTAAAFVPDPFGDVPGARLYRTGDRVRRRGDGRYDFIGRADRQAKLRGFRIEPGETETALRALPTIADAAVAVHDAALVAWIVPATTTLPALADIRAALARDLPAQQIPTVFVPLTAMPLLPNGKIDRRALTVSPATEADDPPADTPLQGATEEMLAQVWQLVLGRARIDRDDDFFAIGGHSLRAVQVVSRIKDQTGIELPLRQMFETPVLSALARAVEAAAGVQPAIDDLPEATIDALLASLSPASLASALPHEQAA